MTYASIVEMAGSQALQARVAACAADEGQTGNVLEWAFSRIWQIAATPGWAPAWDSAQASSSVNYNADTGARDDVITDAMILSAVQPLVETTPA
jgi:hypothetical protein